MIDIKTTQKPAMSFGQLASPFGDAPQGSAAAPMTGGQSGFAGQAGFGGQSVPPMQSQTLSHMQTSQMPQWSGQSASQAPNSGFQQSGFQPPQGMTMGAPQSAPQSAPAQPQGFPPVQGMSQQPPSAPQQPYSPAQGFPPAAQGFPPAQPAQQPYQATPPAQQGYQQPQAQGGASSSLHKAGRVTPLSKGLAKGERFNLSQSNLTRIKVGLSWDPAPGAGDIDLDLVTFGLNPMGQEVNEHYMCFYSNGQTPDGAVRHSGDNRNGSADGDDEYIEIDLARVSPEVDKIACIVSIYSEGPKLTLNLARNPRFHVINADTGETVCYLDLTPGPATQSMLTCEILRSSGSWKARGVGKEFDFDLAGVCRMYNDPRGF